MSVDGWRERARRAIDRIPLRALGRFRTRRWLEREVAMLRRTAPMGAPLEAAVDAVLGSQAFRPEQRRAEMVALLRTLAKAPPRRVLEIGGRRGGTLILFRHVAAPDARLLSIDIAYDDVRSEALAHLAGAGQRLEAWRADSQVASTRNAVRDWLGGVPLDFLFIDGDHSYSAVARDYELYAPLVREGGVIALHDIVPDARTRHGVASASDSGDVPAFWAELKRHHATEEIVEEREQDGFGIGVLRTLPPPTSGGDASPGAHGDTAARLAELRLPDQPILIIQPSPAWQSIDLEALWSYRELLYFLVWRDVKIRYKETVLGVAWALLQPFLAMLVLTALFGRLAKVPSDGAPYALFAYAGLLPWTFFANAVTAASNSLVGSANLLKKVYFPRVLIPAAAVGAALVDLAVGMAGLLLLMAYYGIAPTPSLVALLPLVALTALFALAVGTGLAAVNVKYRDVRYALPFFIQLSMFVTPVIYPSSLLPGRWQGVLALNPLAGIIEGFRAAILGREMDFGALGIATLVILVVTAAALLYFRRTERFFADLV